jgi:MoaA/NifB/PqqE/SkfB family radical SAM enzyme
MKFLDKIKIIRNYWPATKFFFRSILKKDQPFFGLFFQITDRCNAKCLMCFNWQRVNQKTSELSLDEINRFSKSMGVIPSLTVGGGEPFFRDDLPEICKIFYKNNKTARISIPTNSLLTEKILESTKKILEICPARIVIVLSLDGVGEIHDEIRGVKGTFNKVLENYKNLTVLAWEYPNLQINVNTTISSKNQDHLPELINFVDQNLNVNFHTLEVIRGSFNEKIIKVPSPEKYNQLIGQLMTSRTLNKNKYHKLIYFSYHRLALKTMLKKKQLIPCRVSSFMPMIDAEGNVYNCELLPPIGNIKEANYDFMKIWHSDKAKKQRQDIAAKKCYCTHYCYQIQNIVMSPICFLSCLK